MKTRFMIPALMVATSFSASALARGPHDHDRHDRQDHVVQHQPAPAHQVRLPRHHPAARVVLPDARVRRPMAVVPVAYRPTPPAPHLSRVSYPAYSNDHILVPALGAVAGGIIGHQAGDGEVGPIILGAVIGGVIGNQFVR